MAVDQGLERGGIAAFRFSNQTEFEVPLHGSKVYPQTGLFPKNQPGSTRIQADRDAVKENTPSSDGTPDARRTTGCPVHPRSSALRRPWASAFHAPPSAARESPDAPHHR